MLGEKIDAVCYEITLNPISIFFMGPTSKIMLVQSLGLTINMNGKRIRNRSSSTQSEKRTGVVSHNGLMQLIIRTVGDWNAHRGKQIAT